jgi:hypothetical protein
VQVIDTTTLSGVISVDRAVDRQLDPTGSNPNVKVHVEPCDYGGTIKAAFRGQNDPAVILYNFSTRPSAVWIQGIGNATWTQLFRTPYNYWEPLGGYSPGGGSAKLRLTNDAGSIVETAAFVAIDGVFHDTGAQFPPCTPP